jgi:hypothetical protein
MGATPDPRLVGIGAPTPLHVTNRAFAELQAGRSGAPRLSVLTPVHELVESLNAYQPDMIFTYPSFARRLIEEQESGRLRIRPRRVASTAEVLAPDLREHIRATWDAQLLNCYGTTEAALLGRGRVDGSRRRHRAGRHGREGETRRGSAYCLTYFVTPRSCASAVYTLPAASIAMPSPIAPSVEFGIM